jgi:geranylgeranyl diphosphate synthase type I
MMAFSYNEFQAQSLSALDEMMQSVVADEQLAPYDGLIPMLRYHLGWDEPDPQAAQGKRLRPLFLLLTCAAMGGDWRAALPAAASVEILHNFSLIHDDIEDRSDVRRGRATLWSRWGEALAINAGDTMFTLAFQALARLSEACPADVCLQANQILLTTCLELTGGQHLDIANEQANAISLETYWLTVGGKTAALLAACSKLGALIAGGSAQQIDAMGDFARNIGLSFQAQDDWLGIWGDAQKMGKAAGADLLARKKSLPVVYALANPQQFAQYWFEHAITPANVPILTTMLEEEGAKRFTENQTEQFTQAALRRLDSVRIENDAMQALRALAVSLVGRSK